ncbi:ion transporter [Plebeiibacterium sediminum]|uniref:Ion transporter n=1 Tax=Plebeiibacterium sediminum TaxID=2992112 RepID=A0AAE3M2F4_9BACT|nr:ion transporter [Plebeiobacterium sediminum]MCW3785854.1 ion transporter [Plebeiobacterium sediminum]
MKKRIFKLVEKGSHGSVLNVTFDYAIMILIVLNTIAMMLETFPNIKSSLSSFLEIFEITSVAIFTFEYVLRLYISDITHPSTSRIKSIFKFTFSLYGIIDLLAILPFFLPFIIKIDLRFLRMLRLMRFLRLLKIHRYNNSLSLIWNVVKSKKAELMITGFVSILVIFISSFLMYEIEGKAQPEKFPNILESLWWAIATLTTVGYGDVYPITGIGKFISGIIAILGIGLIALPTGIISAGFMDKIEKKSKQVKCPHCGKNI